jgi:two-component system, sensor histidine kinase
MGISELERIVLHELRNKISNLLGYIEILNSPLKDVHELAQQQITSIGLEIRYLTDNVLNYPRLREGELPLTLQSCRPRALIEQQMKHHQLRAEQKQIRLSLDATCNVPETVSCDERWISQILDNLLGNAIKYMEEGAITILLDGGPGEAAGETPWWSLSVSDQAGGMRESVVRFLTGLEQDVPDEIKYKAEGNGYGLVIVKMLVQLLHGKLRVDARTGVGTTVTVTFPQQPPVPSSTATTSSRRRRSRG